MSEWMQALAIGLLAAVVGCATSAAAATQDSHGVAYKWTDEKGVVHYGDTLPPEYSKAESSILNRQGVEVRRLEAQKTSEQLAAERAQQDALTRQKQHDAFLMSTYTSVADIEALRDERLQQIRGQRSAAEQYVEGLHSRLAALQARAMVFKPYNSQPSARRMPDDLAEDLVRTMNEMRVQRGALAAKDREELTLRSQFQTDIERYRELHSLRANR